VPPRKAVFIGDPLEPRKTRACRATPFQLGGGHRSVAEEPKFAKVRNSGICEDLLLGGPVGIRLQMPTFSAAILRAFPRKQLKIREPRLAGAV
jgi:hypothetical protein